MNEHKLRISLAIYLVIMVMVLLLAFIYRTWTILIAGIGVFSVFFFYLIQLLRKRKKS